MKMRKGEQKYGGIKEKREERGEKRGKMPKAQMNISSLVDTKQSMRKE